MKTHTYVEHALREKVHNEELRNAFITQRVEDECAGCEDVPSYDRETGEPLIGFRPAAECPVHGVHVEDFWNGLRAELDRRWPR